jgi:hypothetical protein
MKHGVRIPSQLRDSMARRALKLFEKEESRSKGLLAVQVKFDVSDPTARNLVSRGRFLRNAL